MKIISCFFVLMLTKSALAVVLPQYIEDYKEILFANIHFIYIAEQRANGSIKDALAMSQDGDKHGSCRN